MQISVTSYCMHNYIENGEMDIFGYLETMKYRYRLDTADIWCSPPRGTLPTADDDYLKKVKEGLKERGLTVVNMAIDKGCIWGDTPEETIEHYKTALAYLHAAEVLGAKTVRIDMGGRSLDMADEQYDLIVRRYKEYCKIADSCGFYVGPENHFGPSLSPYNMEKVYKDVNHPAYKVLLHVGRWMVDQEKGDAMVAPYVMHTHFNVDGPKPHGWPLDYVVQEMKLLIKNGYKGCIGIEAGYSLSEVEWQIASLKRAWKRAIDTDGK